MVRGQDTIVSEESCTELDVSQGREDQIENFHCLYLSAFLSQRD